jgi:hypothetical protein
MTSVNQINAGVIVTEARMLGLDLNAALQQAYECTLFNDLDRAAHRAKVVRLVQEIWARDERTKGQPFASFSAQIAACNEKAAAKFGPRWTAALDLPLSHARRDKLAKMRRAADPRAQA